MDEQELAADLLKRYINGEATAEEISRVEKWYQDYEQQQVIVDRNRKEQIAVVMRGKLLEQMSLEQPYQVLPQYRDGEQSSTHFFKQQKDSVLVTLKKSVWIRIAASVLLISALGFGYWNSAYHSPENQLAATPQMVFSTKAGEKRQILLSDGSEITLSPASRLLYPKTFAAKSRTVTLTEGQAFFKIAHDRKRPFTVNLPGQLYTRVLGTSFSIHAFKAQAELKVSVNTGKVAVGNKHQVFGTLIKGQQITYNKIHQQAIIAETPIVDSKIVFDKINLQQAAEQLKYIYSIDIDLEDKQLGELGCTATFHTRQSPQQILDIICSLHNLKLETATDHKSFKIYRK